MSDLTPAVSVVTLATFRSNHEKRRANPAFGWQLDVSRITQLRASPAPAALRV